MEERGTEAQDQKISPQEAPHAPVGETNPKNTGLSRYWIAAILFLGLFALCIPTIPSADTWWHLATGQYVLQTHGVPHTDPFSFTVAGKPWIAHEWLSAVVFYLGFAPLGSAGLLLLASLILTLSFLMAYQRSGGPMPARILALALGVWASSPIFCVRPQIFTYLFASLFFASLTRFYQQGSNRHLFLLPLATILWVNFHGGYILGPTIILLFAAGAVCDWVGGQAEPAVTKRRVAALMITCAACLVVVPLNPNGITMWSYPFTTLNTSSIETGIMEWRSPDFHLTIFRPLAVLLSITISVLALSPKRPKPSQVLLFVFFLLATLFSMRNLPLFVLLAFPLAAEYAYWPNWKLPSWKFGLQKPLQAATLLLVAIVVAKIASDNIGKELDREPARYPVRATAFLDAQKLPAPLFNSYEFGGYLIWRLYPRYRVYVDGRTDLYGDAFLANFIQVYDVNVDPRITLNRDHIRTVMVDPRSALAGFLRTQTGWKRVYEDGVAVIFSR
jgi:hypothetical protein